MRTQLTPATRDRVRKLAAKHAATDSTLLAARLKLRRDLEKWRTTQFGCVPTLRDDISVIDPSTPEAASLLLPSSFSQHHRASLQLDELAKVEYKLREGQAHDALKTLRSSIQTFNYNLKFKLDFVHGQGPNTRAQQYLQTLSADKINAAEKYRRARQALLVLGLSPDDKTLQPLLDGQLWGLDTSKSAKLGDSKKEEPWFWMVGRPSGLSQKEEHEWSIESKFTKFDVFSTDKN